jgi:hypothetical protein
MNRVYIHAGGGPVSQRRMLDSLRHGRSFATNGPLLELSVGGRGPGQDLAVEAGATVPVRVSLRSNVPIDHLELVQSGEVVMEMPLAGSRTRLDATVRLKVERSGWALLRARSERAIYPVLDLYPYATTSPVYLTVAGRPARSSADADYFLRWVARLEQTARASRDWNTDAERDAALAMMARARVELQRRRSEAPEAAAGRP